MHPKFRGLTLAELMLSLGLFALVMGMAGTLLVRGLRTQSLMRERFHELRRCSLAIDQLTREMQICEAIYWPNLTAWAGPGTAYDIPMHANEANSGLQFGRRDHGTTTNLVSCWWLDRGSSTLRNRLCDGAGNGLTGYANPSGHEMAGRVSDFIVIHLSKPNPSFFKISLTLKGEEPMERIVSVKSLW
ncbi:MAG: prepilin-type N-terminal cleavage/methylation domain-containing protein [Vulcanimicrobiota bacterium]